MILKQCYNQSWREPDREYKMCIHGWWVQLYIFWVSDNHYEFSVHAFLHTLPSSIFIEFGLNMRMQCQYGSAFKHNGF